MRCLKQNDRGLATGNVVRARFRAEVKKEILTGVFCSLAIAVLLGGVGELDLAKTKLVQ